MNTTLVHPSLPFVLTCGIEQHVFLHSPTPHVPFSDTLERTPKTVREPGAAVADIDQEQSETIELFDQ